MRHYLKRDETRQLVLTEALLLPKPHLMVNNNAIAGSEKPVMALLAEVMERLAALPYVVFAAEPTDFACMGVSELLYAMNIRSQQVSNGVGAVMVNLEDGFLRYDSCNFVVHRLSVKVFSDDKFRITLMYERVPKDKISFTSLFRQHFIDTFLADN